MIDKIKRWLNYNFIGEKSHVCTHLSLYYKFHLSVKTDSVGFPHNGWESGFRSRYHFALKEDIAYLYCLHLIAHALIKLPCVSQACDALRPRV